MDNPLLRDKAREILMLSDDERILHIQKDRWIGYTRAREITRKLEDLLAYPNVGRAPNMLIVGRTNNGKSSLVKNFLKEHPADDNARGDGIKVPVLYVEAPKKPDLSDFYSRILDLVLSPHKYNDDVTKKEFQVLGVLSKIELGIIIIDEFNNLVSGTPREQRIFLNAIKGLGNQLQRPIVGVGTELALQAVQSDDQTSNRFIPEVLPKWQFDKEFLKVLMSFESILPLKYASNMAKNKALAMKIYAMSEGTIGELSSLLNEAAIWAIRNTNPDGKECINEAALNKCKYISPSARKSVAKLL